ncbi:tyrosine-type recombinase/integrase [Taylorella asinigenitalis]|uniref:Integrase/recombinase n=1 Tax=Taylorella asinigenitalis (strain MCE3) TaxID=1008459 RepID=G4QCQ7_TAYAM|nr:site-specific integrase [Taylorella asinigenitalis]AEP36187.1 integrase/recombinase [Taylorella asinigenitalis MCE3]
MASIFKYRDGYRIQAFIDGKRISKTFPTKKECNEWYLEATLNPKRTKKVTLNEALERYKKSIENLKAYKSNSLRINRFINRFPNLSNKYLYELTAEDFANWRDIRLTEVKPASVRREWAILSGMFKLAINEWLLISDNPMSTVKRPPETPPRERIVTQKEIEAIKYALNQDKDTDTVSNRISYMVDFAVETGMRCGEMCNLLWTDIKYPTLSIREAKTRSGVRKVPLSKRAIDILDRLRELHNSDKVFDVAPNTVGTLFRRARIEAGLSGFTFHDLRATACTRLAKKVNVTDLARILGHSDLSKLMIYYRESAEDIAKKLD